MNTDPKYSERDVSDMIKIAIDVHDRRADETGILCATNCVLRLGSKCGLKNVILTHGMCPHYNPNLKNEDVAFANINPRENRQV
jgi:hypothetical protein